MVNSNVIEFFLNITPNYFYYYTHELMAIGMKATKSTAFGDCNLDFAVSQVVSACQLELV